MYFRVYKMQNISNKMLLWRESVRFFLNFISCFVALGLIIMLEGVENLDDVGKGIVSYGRNLSRSAPHLKNNPNGVGA